MQKEYSDLPSSQKIIYIKRGIIIGIFALIPILITLSFSFIVLYHAFEIENNNYHQINSTTNSIDKKHSEVSNYKIFGIMILLFAVIIGLQNIGMEIGYFLANKLSLYTEINLHEQEKKLEEIKKALNRQKEAGS